MSWDEQPPVKVTRRLIEDYELREGHKGTYSYPYGQGMCEECCDCGKRNIDGDEIVHAPDCPTDAYNKNKPINLAQLKLLHEYVKDAVAIRRMFCAWMATMPYMDDGEAQDNSKLPCIDYLRDTAEQILAKQTQRMINGWQNQTSGG